MTDHDPTDPAVLSDPGAHVNPSVSGVADTSGPDQTDRVILRTAMEEGGLTDPGGLLIVEDVTGELTVAALAEQDVTHVVSWSSSHAATLALRARFSEEITAGRLQIPGGAQPVPLADVAAGTRPRLALMRLPKSLADLEHRARELARGTDLTLVAGGRVKHMTRTQNDVLAGSFTTIRASRGLGKSRALVASTPREGVEPAPLARSSARLRVRGQERTLDLRGIGGVFGGASPDAGSLLLLGALDRALFATATAPTGATAQDAQPEGPAIERAVDLGSGNGLLTAYLAAAWPNAHVLGSDDDSDAVAATRATLAANDLDRDATEVTWDDSLSRVADRSVDLVLLNPPFHDGTAIDATLVQGLLEAATRVLRPGGHLWFVHNSYLRYRTEVEQRVGPARQRSRDRRFTVLSAERV